ncbi:Ubiquitin-conjugating enzyme E2 22 [Ananas comosus]|uniref:Ubiquitin-conjugating enzyme E2 22 n=1 Tax=Ananas comosus TaxID=4615 RepID=A0A199VJV9_ANACO|nr:Ubiquitin-conjugating enzyme E2 22 [Ananas comosus]
MDFPFFVKGSDWKYFVKATNENLPPNVIKQLAKELKNLDETPPEGIKVVVNGDDFSTIYADMTSCKTMLLQKRTAFYNSMICSWTPYENGIFRMKLLFSDQAFLGFFFNTKRRHDKRVIILVAMATNENLPPNVIKQLAKELKNLDETPPEGIKVVVNGDDFSTIYADIEGPAGTPYENGIFRMKLLLSRDFPQSPPKESALNEQAGKMLLENYEEYARHARLYTGIHALKPRIKPKTGAISESTTVLNVDQTNTVLSGKLPQVATPLTSPAASKGSVLNSQDENAIIVPSSEAASGASAVQKKEGVAAAKIQMDKKKMDARKKSLKRL